MTDATDRTGEPDPYASGWDATEPRRRERRGLSTGFKVALASIIGCGGCLSLVVVAVVVFGVQFFDAMSDAPPAGRRFVVAIEDGRVGDAHRMVVRSTRELESFDDDLRETVDYVDALGRPVRSSTTRSFFRSTTSGRFFELGLRRQYENATADWDLVLQQIGEEWQVAGWHVRAGAIREDGSAADADPPSDARPVLREPGLMPVELPND